MSAVPSLTTIGASIWIRGVLRGSEDLVLHGCIEGQVELQGSLHVQKRGLIRANVQAHHVVVAGDVWGKIEADERVEILDSGRVFGDVYAPQVILSSGAILHGFVYDKRAQTGEREAPDAADVAPSEKEEPQSPAIVSTIAPSEDTANAPGHAEPEVRKGAADEAQAGTGFEERESALSMDATSWVERPRMRPISLTPPQARKLPKKNRMGILVKRRGDR